MTKHSTDPVSTSEARIYAHIAVSSVFGVAVFAETLRLVVRCFLLHSGSLRCLTDTVLLVPGVVIADVISTTGFITGLSTVAFAAFVFAGFWMLVVKMTEAVIRITVPSL